MKRFISTPEGLATATGVAILAATTNANVLQTGGWLTSHALLVSALSLGVFAGARVVGLGAGKIGLMIVAALVAGECYNFEATAERIVIERENGAAPLKAAMDKHNETEKRLKTAVAGNPVSARLTLALEAQKKAQAAYEKELREGGRCKSICNGLKDDATKADAEVTAAATEAQKLHSAAIEAAKADVAANPLPASATPLADRLGVPAWLLDLVVAGLLSFGSNVLAGVLIAFGARGVIRESTKNPAANDTDQTDFSASEFDAVKIRSMVGSGFPGKPTPPNKPRKRGRKADERVVDFSEKFRERHGRAPSGGEIKSEFPELPVSTAYDYSARSRISG